MVDNTIIPPKDNAVFRLEPSRDFFKRQYESSRGVTLRSQHECFWHFFLSRAGIAHAYEPEIPDCDFRPDFGVANNFLLEICGAKPGEKFYDKEFSEIIAHLREKREPYMEQGYNILEIFADRYILNGKYFNEGILDTVIEHNSSFWIEPVIVDFTPKITPEPGLYLHPEDNKYWERMKNALAKSS
jgi:hypothetical protein